MLLVLVACQNRDYRVETVLRLAGDNRVELEKVLHYYRRVKADSLKLKAAYFLIGNMPGHCSYVGENIERYYEAAHSIIFSDLGVNEKVDSLNMLAQKYPLSSFQKVEDCSIITADYLIDTIDKAFEDWQLGMCAKGISFDEFCEYLLPYKCVEYQALDNWREELSKVAASATEDFQYNDIWNKSSYWFAKEIVKAVSSDVIPKELNETLKMHSLYKVPFWCYIPSKACTTHSYIILAILRSKGIPAVCDFILQWPTNLDSHTWLNVLVDHKQGLICEGGYDGFVPFIRPGECKGKIYRQTYAANPEIIKLNKESHEVPSVFQNVFMKDVTGEYVTPVDIVFPLLLSKKQKSEKYIYLTVFNNQKWVPIAFSSMERNDLLTFKDVEKGAVYLAAYYLNGNMCPCTYPILLHNTGKQELLKPNLSQLQTIVVKRKYPLIRKAYQSACRLKGGIIQASNDEKFENASTIYSFDSIGVSGYINVCDTNAYRYWRYYQENNTRNCMAELAFYSENNQKIEGKFIGSTPRNPEDSLFNHRAAFDNDPLTYFFAKNGWKTWVGLDFGKPKTVIGINYMIRNDDNNIRIGDLYELFYWDEDGWVSVGKQCAGGMSLTFNKVPSNSLLLLRDLTRGKDERIFVYRDNKQIFY